MSDININDIRRLDGGLLLVFRELLRLQRASLVAERLGLSQPAISHALGRLRDLFGDPLFVRRPHGLEPTRRALELAPQIEALVELAGQTLTPVATFDPAATTRHFVFGAPEFVTALIGGRLIARLADVAPKATFAVAYVDEDDAYRVLRTGQANFALGRFGAPRPGYVTELLFEDRYCVVARRGHPRVQGQIDEPSWREIGHIYAWSPSETANPADERTPEIAMLAAVPQWLTVLTLVAATDGIATVPRRLAERHADMLDLQIIDPPFESDVIRVSAVRRAGVTDDGLDWFLDQVRQAAEV